jgi:class 3 adenylate cyclase
VRRLIDECVTRATGHKVDAHGDEYFGVFCDPGDAVGAAVTMQRAIAAHAWPQGVAVRVRSGLHSGRPELTDSDYVGLSVHTVARICATTHGGQVTVSGQTAAALVLTEGVTLLDLGSHRFAGLPRDEVGVLPGVLRCPSQHRTCKTRHLSRLAVVQTTIQSNTKVDCR